MDTEYRVRVRRALHSAVAALAVATFVLLAPQGSGGSSAPASSGPWYRLALEQGEWQGYSWSVGASGPRHEPLREICALTSVLESFREGAPFIEGGDSQACGALPDATVSMALGETLVSGASTLSLNVVLYRPIVRKVAFILGTGERRIYMPRVPEIPNRSQRGIPVFRYVVASFEGEACVRRITTFDRRGGVIRSERAEGWCPQHDD